MALFKSIGHTVFGGGSSQSPGLFGTGRFKAKTVEIKTDPFEEAIAGAGTQEALRKKQAAQAERLEKQAKGEAPSITEAELKAASERSLAQQLAAAKAARGGSAAARERQLTKSQAEARRDVSQQAAISKLREQQAAEQALANQLSAQRAQDINIAEADRASQQALQTLRVKQNLAAQGLNLSGSQSAAQQRQAMFQNIMEGFGAMEAFSDKTLKKNIKKEDEEEEREVEQKQESPDVREPIKTKAKADVDFDIPPAPEAPPLPEKDKKKGSGLAGIAKLFMSSDEDKKMNKKEENADKKQPSESQKFAKAFVKSSKKKPQMMSTAHGKGLASRMVAEISDKENKKDMKSYSDVEIKIEKEKEDFSPKKFLDALQAYSYEYKKSHKDVSTGGPGRYLSVMAQDLEKAGPVGRSMVKDTPNGKIVDYGKGLASMLACQSHLNDRINKLEKLTGDEGYGKILSARANYNHNMKKYKK